MFKARFLSILILYPFLSTYADEPLIVNQSAQASNPADYKQSYWHASLGQANFSKEKANTEGIEDSALLLLIGLDWQRENWNLGAGIGTLLIQDNSSFKSHVIDQYGNESSESSNISSLLAYGEGGYSVRLLNNSISVDAKFGYEYLSTEREIPNCSDCPSDSVDLSSGFYAKPKINIHLKNFIISASYQQFLKESSRNNISIGIGAKY
ncbi:MAG: hypothetical protein V7765_21185 [Oleispira sp.]